MLRPVRLLWLGNREDAGASHGGPIPVARRRLEAVTEESVEVTARVVWPSDELPGIIAGWLDRYQPDVVMFEQDAYWYLLPLLPLRVERLLGRLGGSRVRSTWPGIPQAHRLQNGTSTTGTRPIATPQDTNALGSEKRGRSTGLGCGPHGPLRTRDRP